MAGIQPGRRLRSFQAGWLLAALTVGCQGSIGERIADLGGQPDANFSADGGRVADASPDSGPFQMLDAGPAPDAAVLVTAEDRDGDGLPDSWETAAGAPNLLDPDRADSDGDGIPDGAEDFDADGLSCLQEFAAGRLALLGDVSAPHPLRRDLLVELDCMRDRCPDEQQLQDAALAYAEVSLPNPDGTTGIGLHFVLDEDDLAPQNFDGSFEQRWAYLANHGPRFDDRGSPPLPLDQFVHVVFAAQRDDLLDRGGETVAGPAGSPEQSGVFVYLDVIDGLFPACGRTVPPAWPDITPGEMVTSTLVHELGHALQLGHDTEAGGGVNYHNIMAVPTGCAEAQMRNHGLENDDPVLGATVLVGAGRFSDAAASLMDFAQKLSADTADANPREM